MSLLGSAFYLDDLVKNRGCNNLKYPNVYEAKDICYDKTHKDVALCDLYFDKSVKTKYPVLLNIHGGGWIVGDKKFRRGFCLQIANSGVFVVNINYGLAPKYQYPFCLQNAFAALRWIEASAEEYNLDLSNVFISGDSAGGHLAATVAVALDNPALRQTLELGDANIKLKGALLYCGVYDFSAPILHWPVAKTMVCALTGNKRKKDFPSYRYYKEISPINYISPAFPKTMIISGQQDFFTATQHPALMQKLSKNNVPYAQYHAKSVLNSFHCFFLKIWMKDAKTCLSQSIKFINDNLA